MAFDAFLDLQRGGKSVIHGETLDKHMRPDHAMQLSSFNLQSSVDLSDETTRATGGSKSVFTIKCKKEVDTATPNLFTAFCMHASKEGKSFDEGKIVVRKASGREQMEFLILSFQEVTLANWKLETSVVSIPDESFDLHFTKLTVTYVPQRATGTAGSAKPAGWDFSIPQKIS